MGQAKKKYDLLERTSRFGENIIRFARTIPQNNINSVLIKQLVRSGTSVGANYCEADDAETKKDFIHKLSICKKEARETRHWLKMILVSNPGTKNQVTSLRQEAKELNLIFNAIIRKTKQNQKN